MSICKRGHASSELPGGRNATRNCIECDKAYRQTLEAQGNQECAHEGVPPDSKEGDDGGSGSCART